MASANKAMDGSAARNELISADLIQDYYHGMGKEAQTDNGNMPNSPFCQYQEVQ